MKRYPYANIYEKQGGQYQAILGGIPNIVVDINNNLKPLDNRIVANGDNTVYKVARGQGRTLIQDKTTNKCLTRLETFTGESLEITLPNLPAATPEILSDGVSIKWVFPQGHEITQYVTEKNLKEIVFQKKNISILFQYKPTGLNVVQKQYTLEFYSQSTGKLVYKTERPYYEKNGTTKYVDITIQNIGNNWQITYLSHTEDRTIDPTITFGEGAGYIGGDHKDTTITPGAPNNSFGATNTLYTTAAGHTILMRFSLAGHIPTNAIVSSAILSLRTQGAAAGPDTISAHRLVTDWGVDRTNEGGTNAPGLVNEPVFAAAFRGVAFWGGGGNFSNVDYVAAEVATVVNAINTVFTWSIPIMTQHWINSDADNVGFAVINTTAVNNTFFDSQEAVVPANRPYLTISYTLPSVRRNLQSKISIPVGIGIH